MSKPMAWGLEIAMISAGLILATQVAAQVTFYEGEEFRGATFRIDTTMPNWFRCNSGRRLDWVADGDPDDQTPGS